MKYNISAVLMTCYPQYIEEWLCYHLLIGIEHFYIYDNNESGEVYKKLIPYIKKGLVDYKYIPKYIRQCHIFEDAIDSYKNETKWMALIDADEFLVPMTKKTILDQIADIEKQFNKKNPDKNIGGIFVKWAYFGSSGNIKYEDKPMIERFKMYVLNHVQFNHRTDGKTIVNPRVVNSSLVWCHIPIKFDDNYYLITGSGNIIKDKTIVRANKIRINHYRNKSFEEFKINRMGVYNIYNNHIYENSNVKSFNNIDEICSLKENYMDKYIDKVKELITYYRGLENVE